MHTKIKELLEKRHIDIKDLTEEEKKTFDRWETTLQGKELTVQKIQDFCAIQQSDIESKWENLDNPTLKNERLIIAHTIYGKILRMISATEKERESLVKHLDELIDNDSGGGL